MNAGYGAALSQKRIDQNSEPGKALQKVVQVKLKDFLGQDYADDVLPLYIVVMLAHGNQADLVADNLEAFLGQAPAQLFVQWYASKLTPPWHMVNMVCVSTCDTFAGCSSISPNQERDMPHRITRATDLRHLLRLTTVRQRGLALRTVKPAQWRKTKDLNQGSRAVIDCHKLCTSGQNHTQVVGPHQLLLESAVAWFLQSRGSSTCTN